ncbi:glutamine-hydrolyzing carbamoyl-phosphate synthase small subunit [uncultured Alistipes sp.]|uniref:glutamine-hydrolyzing carbamoyl-phosphate synthase small subunit n=1 Tax=uncultured Alistipes sp. TaxID=538949 RepID=UPI00260B96BB|nr:glutamine-hydrolyzing carbamoyl-phosphate synthase small subunit [uncultured Alistipes sp.]
MSDKKTARLVLEDGTQFAGHSFGAETSLSGEVVFNTAMTGYPESLTDPSYRGQILVITYPLIGNYGVPAFAEENGMLRFFESDRIHVRGLVVSDYSFEHSHWNAVESLGRWLEDNGVPALYGVDTRQITKIIRERGVMLGKILVEGTPEPAGFEDPNRENLVAQVSTRTVETYGNGKHRIVLVDCGCKYNIVRCLCRRDATVIRVPWDYDFTQIDYDGVMLSNGPGDPQQCKTTVAHIEKAIALGKPIFGICLGNQLLSMAAGARTFKLKYGHRSHNQPALMVGTDRAVITSQNHGYAVDTTTLGADWEPYFVNLNDGTSEGIRHKSKPFFSVQFHPEASGGPVDTEFLFDDFIQNIENAKRQ